MGRPRTDIQPRILHAARARFLTDGVDGASLRTIAKDAKTSVGMIFYYYPTKDGLFLAVVDDVYAKLLADLDVILADGASLRERLRRAFTRIGHATHEEIDVVRLVVREALVQSPRFQQVLARFRRGHVGMILAALAGGVERGEVDPEVPLPLVLIATFGMGGLPQMARRMMSSGFPFAALPETEVLAEAAVDLLFDGIGPRTGKRSDAPLAAPVPKRAAGRKPKTP